MTVLPARTLLAILGLAVVAGVVVRTAHGMIDLDVYRLGGHAVLADTPLYDGRQAGTELPFTYPPFAALLLAPVSVLSAGAAAGLWTAASAAALLGVVVVVRRAQGRADPPQVVVALAAAGLALEPVWQTFGFGQVNLFLLLAVLIDLLLPERRWSGVLVGVAAGIKLTPLVFVVLLVLVGRRASAGRAVAAFAGTVAVGLALLPGTSWTYWTQTVHDAGRVGGPAYSSNQSAYGALTRFLGEQPPTWLWVAVAAPIAAAALVVGARLWRSGDRVLGTCLGGVAMLVASPISWSHHWVWAGVVALGLLPRSRRWALAWTAVFVVAPIWWVPHGEDDELAWSVGQQFLGNAYLLSALTLLAWAIWSNRPLWRAESPTLARRNAGFGAGGPDAAHQNG